MSTSKKDIKDNTKIYLHLLYLLFLSWFSDIRLARLEKHIIGPPFITWNSTGLVTLWLSVVLYYVGRQN